MKITPPNYFQCPNDLVDHWLPHLSGVELKCLLVIIRKTFGWHKMRDRISLSQMVTLTGSTRSNIKEATDKLHQKGIILKEVIGILGQEDTYYEINFMDSKNSYQSQNETPPSPESRPPPVPKQDPQNTLSKNTNKNDDDDRARRVDFPEEKQTHSIEDETDIVTTRTNGRQERISISEVYKHLLPFSFATETIIEAIKRIRKTDTPINNIKKYLESMCRQIETIENSPPTKKPKNKPVMQNTFPVDSTQKTITMAEYLKQKGLKL